MKFDENLAALHGYLCGDGYVSKNLPHQNHKYYIVGLRNQNKTLLKDFQKRFYEFFSIKPKLTEKERCHLNSKEIYYQLMQVGPFHSANWFFPNLPKKFLKFWLRAFFDCEGWVVSRTAQDRRISVESINTNSLVKIKKDLECKFYIPCSFYPRKNRKTSGLHIYGKDNLIKFREEIGFLHPEKREKLDQAIDSFVDYTWHFPQTENKKNKFLKKLLLDRAKIKLPHTVRIMSINNENLKTLSKELLEQHNIISHIYKRKNGQGNKYFEIMIYKKTYLKKMIDKGLLSENQLLRLNRSFFK